MLQLAFVGVHWKSKVMKDEIVLLSFGSKLQFSASSQDFVQKENLVMYVRLANVIQYYPEFSVAKHWCIYILDKLLFLRVYFF